MREDLPMGKFPLFNPSLSAIRPLLTGGGQSKPSTSATNKETTNTNAMKIMVHPNPTTTNLYISVGKLEKQATLEITGMNGQFLRVQGLTRPLQEISLQGLPNGVYYVKVSNGIHISTQKIIKQ